ncbi:hypothetical protein DFH94DRAFT_19880 [Russula ochroleuca]|uniref:BBC1/AIM3 cysteine proteinase-fold domain-containing protein n=1 Tax=Russula ochroleuca TaxID=152965 RepID=A0A9P5N626_9AGAM|nr:hypothetical protein DFH94DRAFT_19880 [Russula ochroleuca]
MVRREKGSRPRVPLVRPLAKQSRLHHHRHESGTADVEKIDWANLSVEDKQAFFAWLDEFFARYLDGPPPSNARSVPISTKSPANTTPAAPPRPPLSLPSRRVSSREASQDTGPDPQDEVAPPAQAASSASRRNLPPLLSQQGPPKIKHYTKPLAPTEMPAPPLPNASTKPSHSADPTDLQMSFPPPAVNGSSAADLAAFMHPSTPWDTEWYNTSSPIPPHLNGSRDIRFAGSFGYSDPRSKTARGVILFSDLSMCWYSVTFGTGPVSRWARFRPRPEPLSGSVLQQAAETYGAAVASFAEHAAGAGRPVGHGECWDVAHEALLHAGSLFGPHDAPILSTSRAHGHLLFCGKPGVGRWRGGDDRFRAGDIVEWRSVRIGMGQYGAFSLLGDPDHTAVLVEDTVPRCSVADGQDVRPADVGVLTVVEQTAGSAPKRDSYDLAKLQQGEVWVYRPVGMVMYLGSTLSIDIPSRLETLAV